MMKKKKKKKRRRRTTKQRRKRNLRTWRDNHYRVSPQQNPSRYATLPMTLIYRSRTCMLTSKTEFPLSRDQRV